VTTEMDRKRQIKVLAGRLAGEPSEQIAHAVAALMEEQATVLDVLVLKLIPCLEQVEKHLEAVPASDLRNRMLAVAMKMQVVDSIKLCRATVATLEAHGYDKPSE
jgi:hypothetical protein